MKPLCSPAIRQRGAARAGAALLLCLLAAASAVARSPQLAARSMAQSDALLFSHAQKAGSFAPAGQNSVELAGPSPAFASLGPDGAKITRTLDGEQCRRYVAYLNELRPGAVLFVINGFGPMASEPEPSFNAIAPQNNPHSPGQASLLRESAACFDDHSNAVTATDPAARPAPGSA